MLLDKYLGGRLCGKQKFYAILIVAAVLLITIVLRYYNFPHFARGVTKLIHLYFFWFFIKKIPQRILLVYFLHPIFGKRLYIVL